MAKRTHRPLYGPNEWGKGCPLCSSFNSKIRGGNYTAGSLYCRRRVCKDCGESFTSKEPLNIGEKIPGRLD